MTIHQQKQLRRTFFRNHSIDKISSFLIKINVVISSSDNICFHQYRIFGKSSKIITIVQITPFSTKRPSYTQHFYSLHSSYIYCSSVRSSSFLRSSFVHPSLFLRYSFVIPSSFVRLFIICPCGSHRLFFVSLFRYYTSSPWEKSPNRRVCDWGEDIFFILPPLIHHRYPIVDPL